MRSFRSCRRNSRWGEVSNDSSNICIDESDEDVLLQPVSDYNTEDV